METPVQNNHNKREYPPIHTAEHILNRTMVNMFHCQRSKNTHIEKKKSKCDYLLNREPLPEEIAEIEKTVNEVIARNLPVTYEFINRNQAPSDVDLSKLPENAGETLRIVRIGDYDICACIGSHVTKTGEIGIFKILSHDYSEGKWRVRWKVQVK